MGRTGQRLERGVLGESGPGFLDFGQLRVGKQVLDEPPVAENGADLAGFVGVAGGEQNFPGHGSKKRWMW